MTVPFEDYVPPVWHDGDAPIVEPPPYVPPFDGDPDPKATKEPATPEPTTSPDPEPEPEPPPRPKK